MAFFCCKKQIRINTRKGGKTKNQKRKEDESFSQIEKKKLITPEEKILEIYNAIFVNKYSGNDYQKTIGKCEFDADSRKFVLVAASMLSQYANYEI